MSFLKKLFGGETDTSSTSSSRPVAEVTHKGFHIATTPMEAGGQFRVCAIISKEIDGETKQHKLIRADLFGSKEDASEVALRKAKQMIDEQGERLLG